MSRTFKTLRLTGDDEKVYSLLAPFAMNPKVIREMGGYPILTDQNLHWFITMNGSKVVAFSAIKVMKDYCLFTYDYTIKDFRRKGLHRSLLQQRIAWCKEEKIQLVKADCTKESLPTYKAEKFKIVQEFVKWTKMERIL
jgi:GNAT superfamily N-acetyltransferase